MDFNEDFKNLTNNINNDLTLRKKYERECQEELEKAINKIKHEYYAKICTVNEHIKNYQTQAFNLYYDILFYSNFKTIEFGKVIASFLTTIIKQKCSFDYIRKNQIDKNEYGIIVLENAYNFVINKINEDFIILNIKDKNGYIKIYEGKYQDYSESCLGFSLKRIEPHINNKINNYEIVTYFVNDFIDFVINYRVQYKLDNLNMRILHKLKNEYLLLKKDKINEYHQEIKQIKTLKKLNEK